MARAVNYGEVSECKVMTIRPLSEYSFTDKATFIYLFIYLFIYCETCDM
jgi:hypothetical protein